MSYAGFCGKVFSVRFRKGFYLFDRCANTHPTVVTRNHGEALRFIVGFRDEVSRDILELNRHNVH
jgi:hypothetical protein